MITAKNKILLPILLSLMSSRTILGGPSRLATPQELVQRAVANEIREADAPGHYMYRMRSESAEGVTTKEVIETKDWLIARLIGKDGRPPSPRQKRREDERLTRLLTNKAALEQESEDLKKNEQHVRELFKALPAAFDYQYAGREQGKGADILIRLNFHPQPQFRPPTQALHVLEGMTGTMLIDATAGRIVRIDARLTQPVTFAWGILARLDAGGTFLLEQRDVGNGRWQMSLLALHFTGKILLFKKLDIDSTTTTSDFRRMPEDMTLLEGLERLKSQDAMDKETRMPKKSRP